MISSSIPFKPILFSLIVPGGGYIYRKRYFAVTLFWVVLGALWTYTVFRFRYDYNYKDLAYFVAQTITAASILFSALDAALEWTSRARATEENHKPALIISVLFWATAIAIFASTQIKQHNRKAAWETQRNQLSTEKFLAIKQKKDDLSKLKEQSLSQCDNNFVKRFDSFWGNQPEPFPVTNNCEIPEAKGWTRHRMTVPLAKLSFSPAVPYTFQREAGSTYSDQGTRSLTFYDGEIQFTIESNTATYTRASNIRWQVGTDSEKRNQWGLSCYIPKRIWCIPNNLILALQDIPGDIGSETVVFAFWNLATNKWHYFEMNEEMLLNHFPDWETAKAGVKGSTIVLQSSKNTFAIRPDKKEWSPLSNETGESIPDSQEGLAESRPTHNRIPIDDVIGVSSAAISQLMQLNPDTEYFFEHAFPPEELLLRDNGKKEAYYFFFRQKATLGDESSKSTAGYFILRQQYPIRLIPLDIRSSNLLEDAFLLRVTENNSIIIRTMDDTHGITLEHYEYKVDLKTGKVEKLGTVTTTIPHTSE